VKYRHGKGEGWKNVAGHAGSGGKPAMSTPEVAKLFGMNPASLRHALARDPNAPAPSFVGRGVKGAVTYYWHEADRNKLALWWMQTHGEGAA